jgi:hypothetical protein
MIADEADGFSICKRNLGEARSRDTWHDSQGSQISRVRS